MLLNHIAVLCTTVNHIYQILWSCRVWRQCPHDYHTGSWTLSAGPPGMQMPDAWRRSSHTDTGNRPLSPQSSCNTLVHLNTFTTILFKFGLIQSFKWNKYLTHLEIDLSEFSNKHPIIYKLYYTKILTGTDKGRSPESPWLEFPGSSYGTAVLPGSGIPWSYDQTKSEQFVNLYL